MAGPPWTPALAELRRGYGDLIAAGLAMNPPPPPTGKRGAPKLGKTGSLLRRLDQRREEVLRFAADVDVQHTNSQAERDLRIVKVQMRISGCWRTDAGAKTFANLGSCFTSTVRRSTATSSTRSPASSTATPGYQPPPETPHEPPSPPE